jgi:von Willebrand factor A domain-containing protein 8
MNQVPHDVKDTIPDHIKEKARGLAREELKRQLEALNMSISEARGYDSILRAVDAHVTSLYQLLES